MSTATLDPAFARAMRRANETRLGPEAGAKANERIAQQVRKRSGDHTEAFVESLNELCRLKGIGTVRKMPTPWRPIRPGPKNIPGSMICVPAEKAGTDYRGHMVNGPAVYAEIKRCSESRLNFKSRLPQHQRDELEGAWRDGQVAVLVVVYGELLATATVHAVPWSDVRELLRRDVKSLGPEDLDPHRVPRTEPWLGRFKPWWKQ